jgi:hypothetical protein
LVSSGARPASPAASVSDSAHGGRRLGTVVGVDLTDAVMGGVASGGVAVARMELARLLRGAVSALRSRGSAGDELGLVLDAVARSDDELAAEYSKLPEAVRSKAAAQLRQVLDDPQYHEIAADARRAVDHSPFSSRQVILHGGSGDIHAPLHVGGDYRVTRH